MSKKQEWTPLAGAVCAVCGSDEMEGCDARKGQGWHKRQTRCLGCGDKRTSNIAPPTAASSARPAGSVELLDLDAIHPESIQPREQMDLFTARDYAERMQRGDQGQVVDAGGDDWTPIVVYREPGQGLVWLADGFHRSEGARLAGLHAIQAQVFTGDKRAALFHALGANGKNALSLSNADKRRIVGLILDDAEWATKLSDTKIAGMCGVSQPFVSKLRGERRQRIKAAETAERAREARAAAPAPADPAPITVMAPPSPAPAESSPQVDLEEMLRNLPCDASGNRVLLHLGGDTQIADVAEDEAARKAAEAEAKRIKQEQRDSWSTPAEFLEQIARPLLGTIDLDPASNVAAQAVVRAARWASAEDDGLAQPWVGRVWLNPPYSYPLVERFADKALEEWEARRVTHMLILVNSSTSSAWWHRLASACSLLTFPGQRIQFWSPHELEGDANRNASTLFCFTRSKETEWMMTLRKAGFVVYRNTLS